MIEDHMWEVFALPLEHRLRENREKIVI